MTNPSTQARPSRTSNNPLLSGYGIAVLVIAAAFAFGIAHTIADAPSVGTQAVEVAP